jgi:transposase
VLEDANIKLATVASRPLGASGRRCCGRSAKASQTPRPWPISPRGNLRAKLPALRAALEGRFREHHALLVSHLLAHIECLDETIEQLTSEIEERMRPFERQRELLCTIPGVAERTAEVIATATRASPEPETANTGATARGSPADERNPRPHQARQPPRDARA